MDRGTTRRWLLIGMWALATLGAVTLGRLAVGVVADQVDLQTSAPLSDAAVRAALDEPDVSGDPVGSDTRQPREKTPSTAGGDRVSTPDSSGDESTPGTTPTPSTAGDDSSDDSGDDAPTESSTTAAPAETRTYDLVGGSVSVRFSGGDTVELVFATPNSGFEVEVKKAGPDEVEVEFESDDHRSRVRARWSNGEPTEEISEQD